MVNVAILGFGTVGSGVAEVLTNISCFFIVSYCDNHNTSSLKTQFRHEQIPPMPITFILMFWCKNTLTTHIWLQCSWDINRTVCI